MILRDKNGIFKVKIHDSAMTVFFEGKIGHWDRNPFKNGGDTAYHVDESGCIDFGPVNVHFFAGDVFVKENT